MKKESLLTRLKRLFEQNNSPNIRHHNSSVEFIRGDYNYNSPCRWEYWQNDIEKKLFLDISSKIITR